MSYLKYEIPLLTLGVLAWMLVGAVAVVFALCGRRGLVQATLAIITFAVNAMLLLHQLLPVVPSTPPGIYLGWLVGGAFMFASLMVSGMVHRKHGRVDDKTFFGTALRVYQAFFTMAAVVGIALFVRLMAWWPQLLMGFAMLFVNYAVAVAYARLAKNAAQSKAT